MLRGIDPRIPPDLLHTLALMGHGDCIAVVDRHFPCSANAQRAHWLPGLDAPTAIDVILTLMPLDGFSQSPAAAMAAPSESWARSDVQTEALAACAARSGRTLEFALLGRDEFYAESQRCFAIVATTEDRPYGCFILTKGVLPEFGPYL